MVSIRSLPAMDINHLNEEHEVQYRLAKTRYPTEDSNDEFELFICPYDPYHRVNSKRWRVHLAACKKNYGGDCKICIFNQAHVVPAPEFEWHNLTCTDRRLIARDQETREWEMATRQNHNPDWVEPEVTEEWDDEIDSNAGAHFQMNLEKGMPMQLLSHNTNQNEKESYEEDYDDGDDDVEGYNSVNQKSSVLEEDLIQERPDNWTEMTKTQKKNHKRKFDRQQQRIKEEGVNEDDFNRATSVDDLTPAQIDAKLNAIKAMFPMNNNKEQASRVDFTSLLNIVCQKIRLNLPTYTPINGGSGGGFAFKCLVFQTYYQGRDYCSNKKDAKHNCAKWALLGMEIPGIDTAVDTRGKREQPIHPRLRQSAQYREADELGKLMASGLYGSKNKTQLRQPNIQGMSTSPIKPSVQQQTPVEQRSSNQISQQVTHQQQTAVQIPQATPLQQPAKAWGGWGAKPAEATQANQQEIQRQQQQQMQQQQRLAQQSEQQRQHEMQKQQQQMQQQSQPQKQWQSQPQQQQMKFSQINSGIQNLDMKDGENFPSLGSSLSGKRQPNPTGVQGGARPRGRGRATAMKL